MLLGLACGVLLRWKVLCCFFFLAESCQLFENKKTMWALDATARCPILVWKATFLDVSGVFTSGKFRASCVSVAIGQNSIFLTSLGTVALYNSLKRKIGYAMGN